MGANAPFSTRGQGGEGERVCPRTGTEKTSLLPPTLVFQRAGEHDGEACLRRPYKLTITAARPPCCRTGLQSAGGAGFVLTDSATGEVIEEGALPVNQATTVECEYLAILAGTAACEQHGVVPSVCSSSDVVVKQLSGASQCRSAATMALFVATFRKLEEVGVAGLIRVQDEQTAAAMALARLGAQRRGRATNDEALDALGWVRKLTGHVASAEAVPPRSAMAAAAAHLRASSRKRRIIERGDRIDGAAGQAANEAADREEEDGEAPMPNSNTPAMWCAAVMADGVRGTLGVVFSNVREARASGLALLELMPMPSMQAAWVSLAQRKMVTATPVVACWLPPNISDHQFMSAMQVLVSTDEYRAASKGSGASMLCGALLDSYVSRDEQHLARYGVAVVSAFPDFVDDLLGRLVLTITDGQGKKHAVPLSIRFKEQGLPDTDAPVCRPALGVAIKGTWYQSADGTVRITCW